MTHLSRIALALSLTSASFATHAITFNPADEPVYLNPDNGHYYQLIDFSDTWRLDWNEAKSFAEGLFYEGRTGHLATITSQPEDDFVWGIGGEGRFLGGFDNSTQDSSGNWIHNPVWQWVTGEAFIFDNWVTGEPNHYEGKEDYLMYWWNNGQIGRWNDTPLDSADYSEGSLRYTTRGFVIEYTTGNLTNVPLPGTMWLFATGLIFLGASLKKRIGA